MKKICTIFFALSTAFLFSCSTQRSVVTTQSNDAYKADSIEYYITEFEVRQKDYLDKLVGTWNMATMQRQARIDAEALTDVRFTLKPDMSFTATTSCGDLSGTYSVKGTSIKFHNLQFSNSACASEQANELSRLLQNTVSAYTVENGSLWLRDGSTNIIFKATR